MASNKNLTTAHKMKILELEKQLPPNANKYKENTIKTNLTTADKNPEPEVFEIFMNDPDASIWDIWIADGSAYFQYDKPILKIIDAMALKTKDAPAELFKHKKTFNNWFNYNNENGGQMSRETGAKYLCHFIKTGTPELQDFLCNSGVINDEWLSIGTVSYEFYNLTHDMKYLPQEAKEVFLF